MKLTPRVLLGLGVAGILILGGTGCGGQADPPASASPVAPTDLTVDVDAATAEPGVVTIRGEIRTINLDRRAFVLATRDRLCLVQVDPKTIIATSARERLRFSRLETGMKVEVRGLPTREGRIVAARAVIVLR